jgi:hypothetical protein
MLKHRDVKVPESNLKRAGRKEGEGKEGKGDYKRLTLGSTYN